MQLLSIAITLVVVVLVSAMILKKYKPHAILLGAVSFYYLVLSSLESTTS